MTWLLNLELACGDSILAITYCLNKSSISREYYVMNQSNDVDFLLRLRSISAFWEQGVFGFDVGVSLYIYVTRPLLFAANFALNTVHRASARSLFGLFLLACQVIPECSSSQHSFSFIPPCHIVGSLYEGTINS